MLLVMAFSGFADEDPRKMWYVIFSTEVTKRCTSLTDIQPIRMGGIEHPQVAVYSLPGCQGYLADGHDAAVKHEGQR